MLTPTDFARSVVAVPPISLTEDLQIDQEANVRVARHILSGGVDILLYGGNANLYHYGEKAYGNALSLMDDLLADIGSGSMEIITSVGPDFGKAMDQIPAIRQSRIKNLMVLPMALPADPRGVAAGLRHMADALGDPLILYVKRENYVHPDEVANLIEEGVVSFVKYAVERREPADDAYLGALVAAIGENRLASGMGETPIVNHISRRGLTTFTSGAVCIAPRTANLILEHLKAEREDDANSLLEPFLEFEKVRAEFGGIQVLHDAVSMAVAPMGPMMPLLSNIPDEAKSKVAASVEALMRLEARSVV